MNTREQYWILRKRKNIKLKDIARFVGCSVGLLSQYENGKANMGKQKIEMYQKYINEK